MDNMYSFEINDNVIKFWSNNPKLLRQITEYISNVVDAEKWRKLPKQALCDPIVFDDEEEA